MVLFIMVNITINISELNNITRIETITYYKYCVMPDYNLILGGIIILLAIPYLFNLNGRLAERLKINPPNPTDSLGTRMYKRLFSDWFYVGNAFYLALFFYLYNIFFA